MRFYLWMCVILMIASCTNLQRTSTPQATAWVTSTPDLSAAVQPVIVNRPIVTATRLCPPAPTTRLIVGERGRVSTRDTRPLNVREGPGTEFNAVGTLKILATFLILDGPRCGGDHVWYLVRSGSIEGWIAEGDSDVYYVEPYLPG